MIKLLCDKCMLPQVIEHDDVIVPLYPYATTEHNIYYFHPKCAKEYSLQNSVKLFTLELCFDNGESIE